MSVTSFTGHRPDKLGGYSPAVTDRLIALGERALRDLGVTEAIVGMALGWDMAVAQAAINLQIPFVAAVPFEGQESRWPDASQLRFRELLAQAARVVIVSSGGYSPRKMHTRNEWMVDNSQRLVALHDGSSGGTGSCVKYARSRRVEVCNMWPFWG